LDPWWVVGFVDGEGCFGIYLQKNATMALGYQVELQFTVTQHKDDVQLLKKLQSFLVVEQFKNM